LELEDLGPGRYSPVSVFRKIDKEYNSAWKAWAQVEKNPLREMEIQTLQYHKLALYNTCATG
jgi:hypothetical protein